MSFNIKPKAAVVAQPPELARKMTRRTALALAGAAPFALSSSRVAAQTEPYPSREIHIVCGFPAGSGADVWVRFFVDQIRPMVPKPIIVENKVGANGNIATEYVARAKPDGYTILSHSPTALAANMFMFKNPSLDIRSSLVNVATMIEFAFYLVVDPKRPWKNLQDVLAHVRERGDKASFADSSASGRLLGNLMNQTLGLKANEVQYRTASDSLNDIASGAIDYAFLDGVISHAQANAGRLKIIGAGTKSRMKSDPDVPTLIEQGAPGVYAPGFFGVLTPKGTPEAINDQINKWYVAALTTKTAQDFIYKFGADPLSTSTADAQKMFIDTIGEWGDLVKRSRIVPQG